MYLLSIIVITILPFEKTTTYCKLILVLHGLLIKCNVWSSNDNDNDNEIILLT